MANKMQLKLKKPVVGLTMTTIVAMEETKRRDRMLSPRERKHMGLNMGERELNEYRRACAEELGITAGGFDLVRMVDDSDDYRY